MECQNLLDKIALRYKEINGENLVGIYVHGSIAFGCFTFDNSDVDFLVVLKNEASLEAKKEMILCMHDLMAEVPKKGFEMSVVLEEHCKTFVYPTPFHLHYGCEYYDKSRKDLDTYCINSKGNDIDLAAHFTVTKAVGIALCGKPVDEVFGEVAPEYYLDSIKIDIEEADELIHKDPVYTILNLCRVLAYLKDSVVISKKQGGEWGMANLPQKYSETAKSALDKYVSHIDFNVDRKTLDDFALYMKKQIFS